jgi:LPXTG-motif cell wall-anchored protein
MNNYRKRFISFLLCLGMIACFNSFNQPVYASNYTTNGVVEFTKSTGTTDTKETTETTEKENGQKPSGGKDSEDDSASSSVKPVGKLPSTGEIISTLSTVGIGLLLVLFCLFLLRQRRREKNEN